MAVPTVSSAQVVLPGAPFDDTVNFFTKRLGFRVDAIFPADAPATAVLSGHGLTLRLQPPEPGLAPGTIRLLCDDPVEAQGGALTAPNGTVVEIVAAEPELALPPLAPSLVVEHL
ncbi:MAG: cupin, partial [Actinobacteria bacterium]|nr:cupin [Actinomycetota bacterium]